jgi:formamidopyrimidine-DNA glycosylase
MTGNFRFEDQPSVGAGSRYHFAGGGTKHDHVVFDLVMTDGTRTALVYADPRRFGFMTLFSDPLACAYLSHLGPEPMGNDFSAPQLAERFLGRRTPVKSALLDQRNVAGLGNIYVSEALWRAGIAPTEPTGRLVDSNGAASPRLDVLVGAIRAVLAEAIAAGGSTLKDFRAADGASGYFQHRFDVYDRDGAACRRPGCSGTITRIVQSGRSSYFCPRCQAESG